MKLLGDSIVIDNYSQTWLKIRQKIPFAKGCNKNPFQAYRGAAVTLREDLYRPLSVLNTLLVLCSSFHVHQWIFFGAPKSLDERIINTIRVRIIFSDMKNECTLYSTHIACINVRYRMTYTAYVCVINLSFFSS